MQRVAAVTGATGFIGGHIVRQLDASGWRVRVLTRRIPVNSLYPNAAVEAVIGDLGDRHALSRLVLGSDAIVHCAGLVRARSHIEFFAANSTGTRYLVEAAIAHAGSTRFVLLSSIAARQPQISDYAASKLAGEAELTRLTDALPWSILRPPAVYGPGDSETLAFFRTLRLGIALLPATKGARVSLIHAADLAAAVVAVLESPATLGGIYEVDDGHANGYAWDEMIDAASRHLGARALRLRIPGPLLRSMARINVALHRLNDSRPMFTPSKVREMFHRDWVCHDGRLPGATNWRPRIALDAGFAETIAWYRHRRWL
jgi:nucleoside-diphosphate-sugar epimerase